MPTGLGAQTRSLRLAIVDPCSLFRRFGGRGIVIVVRVATAARFGPDPARLLAPRRSLSQGLSISLGGSSPPPGCASPARLRGAARSVVLSGRALGDTWETRRQSRAREIGPPQQAGPAKGRFRSEPRRLHHTPLSGNPALNLCEAPLRSITASCSMIGQSCVPTGDGKPRPQGERISLASYPWDGTCAQLATSAPEETIILRKALGASVGGGFASLSRL